MINGKWKVLVVDDEPSNLQLLGQILQEQYQLSFATDGTKALDVAWKVKPDIILLDIMMPTMDGYETCKLLKENATLQNIPIIFISALDETMDKVKAFELGGVDYVTKPFQFEEVVARVGTHLQLRQQQMEIEAQKHQLQDSYDRLRELEQLRDNLVHMIVHDMRSPLMGINGMLKILKDEMADALDEQQAIDFDWALTSGHVLQEMISSLLDISRMEAGNMPLAKEATDLRTIVKDALTSMVALVKECQVTFEQAGSPLSAVCDPEIVRRIIVNLVANAIKFTPPTGEVRIDLSTHSAGVRVSVTDTGPGIPPEYREKIFEKFGMVEIKREGKIPSTGLGLTFCKLAVEAHGGQIGVESEVGKGSTFWFWLPDAEQQEAPTT